MKLEATALRHKQIAPVLAVLLVAQVLALFGVVVYALRATSSGTQNSTPATEKDSAQIARIPAMEKALARLSKLQDVQPLAPDEYPVQARMKPAVIEASTVSAATNAPAPKLSLVLSSTPTSRGVAIVDGQMVREGEAMPDGRQIQSIGEGRIVVLNANGELVEHRIVNTFEDVTVKEGTR